MKSYYNRKGMAYGGNVRKPMAMGGNMMKPMSNTAMGMPKQKNSMMGMAMGNKIGDLNKDGKMSGYETARQNAIEKNMEKKKKKKA